MAGVKLLIKSFGTKVCRIRTGVNFLNFKFIGSSPLLDCKITSINMAKALCCASSSRSLNGSSIVAVKGGCMLQGYGESLENVLKAT